MKAIITTQAKKAEMRVYEKSVSCKHEITGDDERKGVSIFMPNNFFKHSTDIFKKPQNLQDLCLRAVDAKPNFWKTVDAALVIPATDRNFRDFFRSALAQKLYGCSLYKVEMFPEYLELVYCETSNEQYSCGRIRLYLPYKVELRVSANDKHDSSYVSFTKTGKSEMIARFVNNYYGEDVAKFRVVGDDSGCIFVHREHYLNTNVKDVRSLENLVHDWDNDDDGYTYWKA